MRDGVIYSSASYHMLLSDTEKWLVAMNVSYSSSTILNVTNSKVLFTVLLLSAGK